MRTVFIYLLIRIDPGLTARLSDGKVCIPGKVHINIVNIKQLLQKQGMKNVLI